MNYVQSSQRCDGIRARKVYPVLVQLKTLQTRSPSCDVLDPVCEEQLHSINTVCVAAGQRNRQLSVPGASVRRNAYGHSDDLSVNRRTSLKGRPFHGAGLDPVIQSDPTATVNENSSHETRT